MIFPVIKNLVWLKVIFILVTGWDKLLIELLTAFQTKNWINATSSDQWMLHDYFIFNSKFKTVIWCETCISLYM